LKRLVNSFAVGNVIKNGIPVAIVGEPNVGKSTLLNALLNEERAIVSDIAGTTRDSIEDEINIGGIGFRFIDTAGIRETEDIVESIGIKKTFEKIEQSQVVILLVDGSTLHSGTSLDEKLRQIQAEAEKIRSKNPTKPFLLLINKSDTLTENEISSIGETLQEVHFISAKTGNGMEDLQNRLLKFVNTGALRNNETIITNSRHYDSLLRALESIEKVQMGLTEELSSDLMAIDVKETLYHLGEITGEVTNDELLGNIFANFCIGK
jgi:tRNA modification GTPase